MIEDEVRQGWAAGCWLRIVVVLLVFLPVWGILTMSFAQLSGQLDGWRDLAESERLIQSAWAALPLVAGSFALVWAGVRLVGSTSAVMDRLTERRARDRYEELTGDGAQLPAWTDDDEGNGG